MRGKGTPNPKTLLFVTLNSARTCLISHPVIPNSTETRPGIIRASAQYGVEQRIADFCTFDVTRNPWRCGDLFDAIITDPPCELALYLELDRL